ncbi:TIGR03826 family flagellar region protein [Lutispora thermophila]|uniref:Flagellar operon protein TIGR03826 n=1 Tax=Lutispora thermophila DSM 19022 TaxID=1122184 RepID=A0A1M6AQN1_9FIRM|nr:TIGR03826 family flagellar region protein [Lutispora thermophila]SHI38513.1 flagellar operon protein TIGR03826 [Lutispora thermophila DSM 19022]
MPELRNCIRCGRVFAYTYSPICSKCLEQDEEDFRIVKDYLYDNPGSNVFEVSEATGVSVEKIMRFLREERLEISSENSNLVLECEYCGKPIRTGRYCEECKNKLANEMRKEFGLSQMRQEYVRNTGKEKMYIVKKREGK